MNAEYGDGREDARVRVARALRLLSSSISRPPPPAMQFSFALTGKGYVVITTDQTAARSIVKMKDDKAKVKPFAQIFL